MWAVATSIYLFGLIATLGSAPEEETRESALPSGAGVSVVTRAGAPAASPVPMPKVEPRKPGPIPMPRLEPPIPGPIPMPRSEPGGPAWGLGAGRATSAPECSPRPLSGSPPFATNCDGSTPGSVHRSP